MSDYDNSYNGKLDPEWIVTNEAREGISKELMFELWPEWEAAASCARNLQGRGTSKYTGHEASLMNKRQADVILKCAEQGVEGARRGERKAQRSDRKRLCGLWWGALLKRCKQRSGIVLMRLLSGVWVEGARGGPVKSYWGSPGQWKWGKQRMWLYFGGWPSKTCW